jgi:hypothetical protein
MAQTNVQAFSGDVEITSNLAVSGSKFTYDNTNTTVFTGTSTGGANEIGVWNVANNSADNTFIDVWVIGTSGNYGGQMHYRVYNRPDAGGSTIIKTFERDNGSIAPVVYRTNADDMRNGVIRIGYENSYSQFITWRVKVTTRYMTQGVFQVTNTGSAVDGTGLVQVTPAPATELTSNLMVGGSDLFVDTVNSMVGIGTTNPETTLDIVSTTTLTNTPVTGLLLQSTTSGTATDGFGTKMEFRAERGDGFMQTRCGTIDVSGRNLAGTGDVWDMRFNVRNDESIDTLLNLQSGRGVRTFQGLRAESAENHSLDRYFPDNGEFPSHTLSLLYQNTRSYNTGPGINFSGSYSTSSAFMASYATIKGVADSPSGNHGALRFYVNKGAGSSSQIQIMKINSTGTVDIHKQNPTENWTDDDPCLRLVATNASPSYLEFDNNRSWVFKSVGTDQGIGLSLNSTVNAKFFRITNTDDACFDFYTVQDSAITTTLYPYLHIPNGVLDIKGATASGYDDITGAKLLLRNGSRNQIYVGSPAGGGDFMWFVGSGGNGTIAGRHIMTLNGGSRTVGIGTTTPKILFNTFTSYANSGGTMVAEGAHANDTNARQMLEGMVAPSILMPVPQASNADDVVIYWKGSLASEYKVTIDGATFFTGQHAGVPDNYDLKSNVSNYTGLIVRPADTGYKSYNHRTGVTQVGQKAIEINESLPYIKLSEKAYDKSVFGVLSNAPNNTPCDEYGNLEVDDDPNRKFSNTLRDRVRINSLGEGAIWVTDLNGNLENGDYITSSNVSGYGMKQDSEFLANYTVAKITMSCDFNPNTITVKQHKKVFKTNKYWVKYGSYEEVEYKVYEDTPEDQRKMQNIQEFFNTETGEPPISLADYNTLDESNAATYTSQFRDQYLIRGMDKRPYEKPPPERMREDFEVITVDEYVDDLDENGVVILEDVPGETELEYKIRYLDMNGNIVDESNASCKAAFVGCTYHCG